MQGMICGRHGRWSVAWLGALELSRLSRTRHIKKVESSFLPPENIYFPPNLVKRFSDFVSLIDRLPVVKRNIKEWQSPDVDFLLTPSSENCLTNRHTLRNLTPKSESKSKTWCQCHGVSPIPILSYAHLSTRSLSITEMEEQKVQANESQPRRQPRSGRRGQGRGVGIESGGRDDVQPPRPRQLRGGGDDAPTTTPINDEAANNKRNGRQRRRGGRGGGSGNNNDTQSIDAPPTATSTTSGAIAELSCPRTEQAMQFIADSMSRGSNSVEPTTITATQEGNELPATTNSATDTIVRGHDGAEGMPKKRNRKKGARQSNQLKSENEANHSATRNQQQQQRPQQQTNDANTKKKKRNRNSRKKNPNAAPWREFIPQDLDDPISLEPLIKLPYPPFAIVVEPPYIPVWPGMWPPPSPQPTTSTAGVSSSSLLLENGNVKTAENDHMMGSSIHDEKERQISILREQWGEDKISAVHSNVLDETVDFKNTKLPATKATSTTSDRKAGGTSSTINDDVSSSTDNIHGRHVNLFDGRVLAYYLVSTLQFIDPYNRRDLTRPELQALDAYLAQHKLGHAGVVEAYDDKGVTISTAGRAAQTSTGRAEILQQEARAILGSFFQHAGGSGGGGGSAQQRDNRQRDVRRVNSLGNVRDDEVQGASRFQRLYAAQQGGAHRANVPQSVARQAQPELSDTGIYEGEGGGVLLIDDDINPGLRGGIPVSENAHEDITTMRGTRYSARHIAERHGHDAQVREEAFPSLTSVIPAASAAVLGDESNNGISATTPLSAPSRSLSKISNLIEKTDPKQIERQRKAREEALRRAELSKLSFFNPENAPVSLANTDINQTAQLANMPPSEAVLERNRNLAMALGVAPSTVRNEPSLTGWARPAYTGNAFESELEMNTAQYPEPLLAEAKERMAELIKLERKWNQCLLDDRAMSCSLKPMNRPTRKFVHEYSDYWFFRTESFDPEGKRYIHCAKMKDTRAPHPLLSEAARKWSGPTDGPSSRDIDMAMLPRGPAPKVEITSSSATTSAGGGSEHKTEPGATSSLFSSGTGERQPASRFAGLLEKERPKLQLAPRSIPTWDQLEKLHISQNGWNEMTPGQQDQIMREIEQDTAKKEAQLRREKEKEDARTKRLESKAKQRQLAMKKKQALLESAFVSSDEENCGSDSEWSEDEAVFDGSDDEAM